MKLGIYAVRDRAADAWLPPFFLPTDSMALREFEYCAKEPNHKFCQHKVDFSLYKLGEFDDATGLIVARSEPFFMLSAEVGHVA